MPPAERGRISNHPSDSLSRQFVNRRSKKVLPSPSYFSEIPVWSSYYIKDGVLLFPPRCKKGRCMVDDESVGALPQKGEAEVCALDELSPGVDGNATEAVKPPQVRREEMRPLALEQVKVLLQATRDERLEAL
jgi:hypothetical protein